MNHVDTSERTTQNRIVELFQQELDYHYFGNLQYRTGNSNVEVELLQRFLEGKYPQEKINRAIDKIKAAADDPGTESLYHKNKTVYNLLRYGVKVKTDPGHPHETIHLINWKDAKANDFYIAEEVTIRGEQEKRPDIVLYINGIAVAVLELKKSSQSIGEGIRQNRTNQQSRFIQPFFTTIQYVLAGNDSEGLRYGTIGTEEKYFLKWKEDETDNEGYKLDKYLKKLCSKERLIEIIRDFVIFDGGIKKLPRVHQYFGIKEAQEFARRREGGIIWHTQGSGKSITMVLLAKWILEKIPSARVLVVTDRDELDEQIERVFHDVGQEIYRTSGGADLIGQLGKATPRLLCSLVHKFNRRDAKNFEKLIRELEEGPVLSVGDLFVFVDECHRTQSGRLHKIMRTVIPNGVFIGFTGTPLLKNDRETSLEVFGKYIHTYKYKEAVEDKVVLDLVYIARDIDQQLSSQERVDKWFEAKTKTLNDFQKAELKKRWGTMQRVLSSRNRMSKIISDIELDFATELRLEDGTGNAMLVAQGIYEACRYYEMFQQTSLRGRCAVITSYNPKTKDIATEDSGEGTESEREYVYKIYSEILEKVKKQPSKSKTETYEAQSKKLFKDEPANMRLLIVVDKLLTGFDSASCTYLYIDKSMQDHGLFQAICRTNRLDDESKAYGYIVDYKDLFPKLENAVAVYTSELDYDTFDKEECAILLKDRLSAGKKRLDEALEALELMCEQIEPPQGNLEYIRYFCGNTDIATDIKEREPLRYTFYKLIVNFIRAYAAIGDSLSEAGYTDKEIEELKNTLTHYRNMREVIRRASNEILDTKAYDSEMRHLIDTYIQADDSVVVSPFGEMPLMEVIEKSGIAEVADKLQKELQLNEEATAEIIENNVRKNILKEQLLNPAYFEEMSTLLDEIIKKRKEKALEYQEYLKEIANCIQNHAEWEKSATVGKINTPGKRALYDNLGEDEVLVIEVDAAIKLVRRDQWRGHSGKENAIRRELLEILKDASEVERIFDIIKNQPEY